MPENSLEILKLITREELKGLYSLSPFSFLSLQNAINAYSNINVNYFKNKFNKTNWKIYRIKCVREKDSSKLTRDLYL